MPNSHYTLLTTCITQALFLRTTIISPNTSSSHSPTDPEMQQTSVQSHARPTSGQEPTPDFSRKTRSRMASAGVSAHSTSLSTVEEKDTTTSEDPLIKDSLEKADAELALPAAQQDQGPVTNSHGKRDPFANEDGNGIQYKTMAWWYVKL